MTTSQPIATVAHRLWATLPAGADDLADLLGDGPSPRVPFGQAGQLKAEVTGAGRISRDAAIARVLSARPQLEQVDPRGLLATQGGPNREGIRYYLATNYTRWGLTYADRDRIGNADPVILLRARDGARLILAGHHRATVALLRGQPLLARVAREDDTDDGLPVPGPHHVTPLLTFGSAPQAWPSVHHEQPAAAAEAMRRGQGGARARTGYRCPCSARPRRARRPRRGAGAVRPNGAVLVTTRLPLGPCQSYAAGH